jgi:hypothetical protein
MGSDDIPHWIDPRKELPDADMIVRVIINDGVGDVTMFDASLHSTDEWCDRNGRLYQACEVLVWRDLSEDEAEAAV